MSDDEIKQGASEPVVLSEKERLDIEKVRLEVEQLRRPAWMIWYHPTTFGPTFVAFLAAAIALISAWQLNVFESRNTLLEIRTYELRRTEDSLTHVNDSIRDMFQSSEKKYTDSLNGLVSVLGLQSSTIQDLQSLLSMQSNRLQSTIVKLTQSNSTDTLISYLQDSLKIVKDLYRSLTAPRIDRIVGLSGFVLSNSGFTVFGKNFGVGNGSVCAEILMLDSVYDYFEPDDASYNPRPGMYVHRRDSSKREVKVVAGGACSESDEIRSWSDSVVVYDEIGLRHVGRSLNEAMHAFYRKNGYQPSLTYRVTLKRKDGAEVVYVSP